MSESTISTTESPPQEEDGLEVFTEPWVEAWKEELASSDAYREAAETWEGTLVLELAAEDGDGFDADRAAFLDLWHGECRAARVAVDGERESADYVIRGASSQWRRVLAGELEPIWGLMSGKLKLTRGNLAKLTRYVTASKELVAAAGQIGSTFPEPETSETPETSS